MSSKKRVKSVLFPIAMLSIATTVVVKQMSKYRNLFIQSILSHVRPSPRTVMLIVWQCNISCLDSSVIICCYIWKFIRTFRYIATFFCFFFLHLNNWSFRPEELEYLSAFQNLCSLSSSTFLHGVCFKFCLFCYNSTSLPDLRVWF